LFSIQVAATGEPLIRKVSLVDEILPGSRRRFLPDLILDWAPEAPVDRICSPDIGEIEISLATGRGGNHNASAFVIAKGADAFLREVHSISDISGLGNLAESLLVRNVDLHYA
jgi:hypothetical protein